MLALIIDPGNCKNAKHGIKSVFGRASVAPQELPAAPSFNGAPDS